MRGPAEFELTEGKPVRKNDDLTVRNFGCRLNALDGDHIRDAAHKAGLAQATIINSCAVTSEAVRQARQAVRKVAKTKPETPIIVTGCAAQTDGETFAAMPEVNKVLGNEEKFLPSSYASKYTQQDETIQVSDIMAFTRAVPRLNVPQQNRDARFLFRCKQGVTIDVHFALSHSGAEILVQPRLAEVVENCQTLVASGHREIVLSGVDITSWGGGPYSF